MLLASFSVVLGSLLGAATATTVSLSVGSSGGSAVSPLQYGLMFEDINHSGDGGIYAELVQNRAFQGATTVSPFTAVGSATLSLTNTTVPLSSALPQSMEVTSTGKNGTVGFANSGWWGIEVKPQTYTGTFYVYGAYSGGFTAALVSDTNGQTFATANINKSSVANAWTQFNYTLTPTDTAPDVNNSLQITFDASKASGSLNFNFISLFPPTYKDRPNGMRIDLMEALAGLNPSFLRMPGGNNLEGNPTDGSIRWTWNATIGPLIDRPGRLGDWGYENTDGLGLVEYLYWCIDLGMEPILAVWDGLYLDGTIIPESEIDIYVQDALNELEFIMGDSSTTYGALRVSLGYGSEPIYNIKYVEVGNEDDIVSTESLETYQQYRWDAFYDAIHAAYPDIIVIASTIEVTYPSGNTSYGDYHLYTRPDDFVNNFDQFDNSSTVHKTLIGEYASVQPNLQGETGTDWSTGRMPYPFWVGTVAESIYLLGAERNAAAILGASYAPTLQNLDSYEWTPDLISFDADTDDTTLSTSWHMISLFSNTRIAEVLPTSSTSYNTSYGPAYWVAGTSASSSGSYVFKTSVYNSTGDVNYSVSFPSTSSGATANLTVLTAPDPYSENTVGTNVVITTSNTVTASGNGSFAFSVPNYGIALLVVE
ncbi:putative alpha-l-arabinofuranosidase a [Phaeomoniella chlamydospora]|uniref:non-reducing end alpha-L-arabinofuranosidase n=1 Tax=Phaeomoniella chlamydospora TaxID=158046 RepID=A0A0G2GIU3_PHACM|nr:putative alpha-l-arabinofuranosidase a [Phaeomoniella chlamydospora]